MGELECKGDGLTHGFELDSSVLFEDEFGEEDSLVEPRIPANPVDIVLIELMNLGRHQLNL